MTGWWRSGWSGLVSLALVVASLLPALETPVTGSADPALVVTVDGPVRGEAEDGYRVFRGLPFAVPPVGELRWQAPQPVAPWTEVRLATESASPCVQPADLLIGDRTST